MRELKPGTKCTVIGWGKKEDKSSSSVAASATYEAAVNEVQVPILNRDLCNEWLETLNVTEGMICAGYQEGGKDACQVFISFLFYLLLQINLIIFFNFEIIKNI